MRLPLQIGLAVAILAGAATAQAQMRFQGMDRNNDGVITRDEWRGNDHSFRNQDWNGDGVLSGDEVRPGARRQTQLGPGLEPRRQRRQAGHPDRPALQRLRHEQRRPRGTQRMARRRRVCSPSRRQPRRLSRRCRSTSQGGGFNLDAHGGPAYPLLRTRRNRDGWITRNEWSMGDADFNRLDVNRDNRDQPRSSSKTTPMPAAQ